MQSLGEYLQVLWIRDWAIRVSRVQGVIWEELASDCMSGDRFFFFFCVCVGGGGGGGRVHVCVPRDFSG